MRARSMAALALAALVLAGPLSYRGQGAEPGCERVVNEGAWTGIANPLPGAPVAYAVDPNQPDWMYITDGRVLQVSSDGGCSWDPALDVTVAPTPELPVLGPASSIETIDIPESPAAAGRLYVVVEERAPSGPTIRPHVVISDDRGKTWRLSDAGLPPVAGEVVELAVAPSHSDTIYLFLKSLPGAGGDDVYASTDGGRTWERRSTDSVPTAGAAIDPLVPEEMWTWGGAGLWHSNNGGRTRQIETSVAVTSMADVFHGPQAPARIMAYEPETQTFNVSPDGGANWFRIGGPRGFAISMTHAASPNDVVVSVHQAVFRFEAPAYWIEISPPELYDIVGDIRALTADRTADPAIYGLADTGIVKYTGLGSSVDLLPFDVGDVDDATGSPELFPRRTALEIPAGSRRTVPYKLALPPKPTPLDVYFLVDTTVSMQSSIDGLRSGMQSIIDELANSGIDVQFGVGFYKDYPTPGYGDPLAGDRAYVRLRPIGPVNDDLTSALEALEATGGGDIPEAQLTGLYQAATGEGQAGFVEPGQQAGFRPGALRTIVNITDAPFHSGAAYPSPSFDTVASTLRKEQILQIGLAVFGPNGNDGALADLSRMADMTGTVAPAGGVDCDGDGNADIRAGGSLVCEIRDETRAGVLSLAPAIISTLRAVSEEVDIAISTGRVDGLEARITPRRFQTVDLRNVSELPFEVTFTCPRSPEPAVHEVDVEAAARGQRIAQALARVRCGPVAVEPVPPALLAPVIPALVRPILPPPPPVPQQLPPQQSNPQAQSALAKQKQEQPQMAFVQATRLVADLEGATDYAMVRTRRPETGPSPAFFATASAMALAFAFASRTRHRLALARVRRR